MREVQQLGVKLFATDDSRLDQGALIPIFHRWIREERLPGLLIDVADYRHVPDGPGVMIIAHEAHYATDQAGGLGLQYNRKRDDFGPLDEKLREALRAAVEAASALEQEPSIADTLRFRGDRVRVQFLSRIAAPNDDGTWADVEPTLRDFFAALYPGAKVELTRGSDPRKPLTAEVSATADVALSVLRERLG